MKGSQIPPAVMAGFGGRSNGSPNGASSVMRVVDGVVIGESNFSPVPVGGGVGGMKAPLNGRIASAITVHGGSHSSAARLVGRACVWYGSNPATARAAGRSRCVVRECQRHDARTRSHCAVRRNGCLIVIAVMPRRRASDRRLQGGC